MAARMPTPTLAEFEFEIGSRIGRGDFLGADAAAAACRATFPSNRAVWLLGSFAALGAGKKETALTLIEQCLATDPDDVQYLLQHAECLMALGRRSDALAAAAKAGASARADVAAFQTIGQFFANARNYPRALENYDKALAAAPHSLPLLAQRSAVHRLLGNFELAARDYETVLAVSPLHPDALKGLVDLAPQSPEHNYIVPLQAALAQAGPESIEACVLHFALAKSQEDMGDFASSWRHLTLANRLERARSHYNRENDRKVIEEIISAFAQVEPKRHDTTGERPIFIVGLPRTGTTLVERIVGSHSQVHSAGELPALSQAIGAAVNSQAQGQSRNWQEFAARLGQVDGESIAREYLALSQPQRGERARFSDKQPTNFFYCALILRAFPQARIVHLRRHPLAACYAIYKTRFDEGFPFAYDLDELGDFYAGYHRLMQHWHRVLPGRILDIAYEDIVTSQEATTRRLLEYLDLPFEQTCLDFHLNPAPLTNTANAVQVRQPLYQSSLQQWLHYSAGLAPLRARLTAAGIDVD
ncbi:MAG: sulfotransferase [Steroidobacteraceae bacterium]